MENILAVIAVLVLVVTFTFGLKVIIRKIAEQKRKQEESDKFWASERVRIKQIAEERTLARLANIQNTTPPKKQLDVYASGTNGRSTYTSQPVQSSSLLSDIADVAMIASTVRHWNDTYHSESVREERSVGVSKSESSWGFDDSDSRKSVSSSMDTSSSWSSSDSSSSSDSGPSSDW